MTAATWLFVPGDRPERFDKAAASGADEVIIDLEDAVAPDHKGAARDAVANWLMDHRSWVRINAVGADAHAADLAALAGAEGLRGVVVPKSEDPEQLRHLHKMLDRPIVALIETAGGLAAAEAIARTQGVERLAFGSVDLALDLGADDAREPLLFARSALVFASRLARLAAPVDGVTTQLEDLARVRDDARYARSLGFGGKLCIHPTQVEPVAEAFAPSASELAWAADVLAAGPGASQVAGAMVDEPVLRRAQRLLDHSSEHGGAGPDAERG